MSSPIQNKQTVDFLWDWTEDKDWKKLLIHSVVIGQTSLSNTERETVFNYFLQSIGLANKLPKLNLLKPNFSLSSKTVKLISLSNVQGVNRLAKGQTIRFGKNLTVIFGENGTGKTGYGRILKSIGFSYDIQDTIYGNIFSSDSEQQSADLQYEINGLNKDFLWNGINNSEDLQAISVFNSNCVQISLSDRELLVTPIGFHLFSLVTEELTELAKLLNQKI